MPLLELTNILSQRVPLILDLTVCSLPMLQIIIGHLSLYMLKAQTIGYNNSLSVCVASQARDSASLRESLHAERESHNTEVEQLRSALLKLQQQLQEQSQAVPSFTAKQEEERRRAEERAAQEIHRLTQVCVSTTAQQLP